MRIEADTSDRRRRRLVRNDFGGGQVAVGDRSPASNCGELKNVPPKLPHAQAPSEWPPSKAQMDAWNAEADAEAERELRQQNSCTVQTASGATYQCNQSGRKAPH
jgi:hypothetical protein